MSKPGSLREVMPQVAAWVDELRECFGRAEIDRQIAGGMAGRPTFHASENGMEIGTPIEWDAARAINAGQMVIGKPNVNGSKARR